METIALVDPIWSGHHPTYLKFFSQALLQLGHRVIVFCPEPEKLRSMVEYSQLIGSETWQTVAYQLASEQRVKNSRLAARSVALERLRHLAQMLTAAEQGAGVPIDLVFFCFIDTFIGNWQTMADLDRLLGRQFSGLYFHPRHLRVKAQYSWLRRGPFNRDSVLRSCYCRSVAVLDEGIAQELSKRLMGKPVVSFPDITNEGYSDLPQELEEVRRKAKERKIIGLLGSLEKRKGLLEFMCHTRAMKDQAVFFLIVGVVAEYSFTQEEIKSINSFMNEPPENVFIYRGFVEDEITLNGLIRCCDLLYAVYHNFPHSSNFLTKSASMNVPIVVSDRYLMAERVNQFNLGFVVREDTPEDFRTLVSSGRAFNFKSEDKFDNGCREYMEKHRFERLVDCFRQLLKYCDEPV